MDRKGTVMDVLTIAISLFLSAIGIFIAATIFDAFDAQYDPKGETAIHVLARGAVATRRFNAGFVIYTVGAIIAAVILAFMIPAHPIMFPISLMLLGLLLLVIPQLSNAFESFITNSTMASIGNEFSLIVFIMRNLPTILTGAGFLIMLAMFAKPRGGI